MKKHPQKLWVEKSNNHRGIHIKLPKGMWQKNSNNTSSTTCRFALLYTLLTYSVYVFTEINTENEKKNIN